MPAADIRQEFAPPHTPGMLRAVVLALLAHSALVAVLAIGVAWKRELPPTTVEAELWSAIPQEAAPAPPEETPPEPDTAPQPEVKPVPEPPAPPPVVKQAVPEAPSKADIALAKEKERLIEEQKAKDLQAKQEQERKALEKRQQELAAKDKAEKERSTQAKLKEQQEKAAKDKAEKAKKAEAADKAKAADAAKRKAEKAAKEDAKRAELERQQQLNRLTGLAGAAGSGTANATGTAAKSSGPGASYNGLIQSAVKKNIVTADIIVGNPQTEITVTLSLTGEILTQKITKSSGNASWDDVADRAITKTRKLPLDNGRVISPMIIIISPQTLLGP